MNRQQRGDMILALRPRAKYRGCWYDDSVVWLDEEPMPTEKEIKAQWKKFQEEIQAAELRKEIERKFYEDISAPVPCVVPEVSDKPIEMDGGFESAQRILGAHDLAVALGEDKVYLTDKDDTPHLLPTEAAKAVAVQIGVKCRDAFLNKQIALNQLKIG